MTEDVVSAFERLDRWISSNGYAGYDPYDVRGQDWYAKAFRSRKVRGLLARIEQHMPPHGIRAVLKIKKEINAKGMGLIASAYLSRYRSTGNRVYLEKAEFVLEWLAGNQAKGFPGSSWGYPFNWHSRVFIPRGTPSIVVTGTVGDAWLDHFEMTGAAESLRIAKGIQEFIFNGLHRSFEEPERLCFSYTPIDQFQVTNATLFAAAFLARIGALTGDEASIITSIRSARYAVSQQHSDGSFPYWGFEPDSIVDHYHTGFVLRHLFTVWRSLDQAWLIEPLEKGYQFYLERLFTDQGLPKFTPDSYYPVDIHSIAEALLCLGALRHVLGDGGRLAATFNFSQNEMVMPDGWYIAGIRKRWWGTQRIVVPYMRWSQAWMLLALARLGEGEAECESE